MSELNVKALLDAGASLGEIRGWPDAAPFVLVPDDYTLHSVEDRLPAPMRNHGTTVLNDQDSFVAFVNLHKTKETDLFFNNSRTPSFMAVFNAARKGLPAWGDHRAYYPMPLSPEWKIWTGANGTKMGQEDFARFIESNLPDIISPESSAMLEVALTLEAKKRVNFASGLRLSNGSNQLTYEEQVDGTAAKGALQVPDEIKLGIPVFEGGDRYEVVAKFRYRIQDGGKLVMWYELVRPHKIIEDAVKQARDAICKAVGLGAFNGAPAE